jgi:hypothetical protein
MNKIHAKTRTQSLKLSYSKPEQNKKWLTVSLLPSQSVQATVIPRGVPKWQAPSLTDK